MIEKVTALDHIDEICSIPGVDMVQFGSGDWSMNQGFDRTAMRDTGNCNMQDAVAESGALDETIPALASSDKLPQVGAELPAYGGLMKTLILNGSPRENGDTASLIKKVTRKIPGEYKLINAYRCNISPCIDCRYCWEHTGCAIEDEMQEVYAYIQECDNI